MDVQEILFGYYYWEVHYCDPSISVVRILRNQVMCEPGSEVSEVVPGIVEQLREYFFQSLYGSNVGSMIRRYLSWVWIGNYVSPYGLNLR